MATTMRVWFALTVALLGGAALADPQEVEGHASAAEPNPVRVQLQGGIEGYAHHLAPLLQVGPTYGVSVSIDPFRYLGFEFGYSGALNELRSGPFGVENANPGGPDLTRNGGYLAVTPGVAFALDPRDDTEIKPYVLGGVGIDRYVPKGNTASFGYRAGTVAAYPFGLGLKTRVGKITADARFNYAYESGDQWAASDPNPIRYQGQVLVGAAF